MGVDAWFWGWVGKHCERFPRGDWPDGEKEYWQEIRRLFVTKGVTEEVATRASREMFGLPAPEFVGDHPAALLARVREIWRVANGVAVPTPAPTTDDGRHAEFDRRAYAHWEAIDEDERNEARRLVRERAVWLAKTPRMAEMLAVAWAYEPGSVIAPEPQRDRAVEQLAKRGVKQIFQHPKFKE